MGLENSSELFTISVNGVLYLQVCGAVVTMWGGGVCVCVGVLVDALGHWHSTSDTPKCWCWLEKSRASGHILPPTLVPQPVLVGAQNLMRPEPLGLWEAQELCSMWNLSDGLFYHCGWDLLESKEVYGVLT